MRLKKLRKQLRNPRLLLVIVLAATTVGCVDDSDRQSNFSSQASIETLPQPESTSSLADAVQGWTIDDENDELADKFLASGVSRIQPGKLYADSTSTMNHFWTYPRFEVCPGLYSLAAMGSGPVPFVSWFQANGNYVQDGDSPLIGFEYLVSVFRANELTPESLVSAFDQYIATNGDGCEFTSSMWRLSIEQIGSCKKYEAPGYDMQCLEQADSNLEGTNVGKMFSRLVYTNDGQPSIFSVTGLVPFQNRRGGYTRKAMTRKLFVIPETSDVYEVVAVFEGDDLSITDTKFTEVVGDISDIFFEFVGDSLRNRLLAYSG